MENIDCGEEIARRKKGGSDDGSEEPLLGKECRNGAGYVRDNKH